MNLRWPSVREFVGGVGTILLVLAMFVMFAPGVLPPVVVEAVSVLEAQVEAWVVTLVLSLVVFLYALYRFRSSDEVDVERLVDEESTADVPDLSTSDVEFDPERPGRGFDYAVARAVAELESDPNGVAWESTQVRKTLKEAVHAVRADADRDSDAVDAEVADGSWTDDHVAAAFLGGADAPGVSLWRRLYAWLYPAQAFERRVERVVVAIEEQSRVEPGEDEASDGRTGRGDDASESGDGDRDEDLANGDGNGPGSSDEGMSHERDRGDAVTAPGSGTDDDPEGVAS